MARRRTARERSFEPLVLFSGLLGLGRVRPHATDPSTWGRVEPEDLAPRTAMNRLLCLAFSLIVLICRRGRPSFDMGLYCDTWGARSRCGGVGYHSCFLWFLCVWLLTFFSS